MQGLSRNALKNIHIFHSLKFYYKTLTDTDMKLTENCIKKIEEKTETTTHKFLRLTVEAGGSWKFNRKIVEC